MCCIWEIWAQVQYIQESFYSELIRKEVTIRMIHKLSEIDSSKSQWITGILTNVWVISWNVSLLWMKNWAELTKELKKDVSIWKYEGMFFVISQTYICHKYLNNYIFYRKCMSVSCINYWSFSWSNLCIILLWGYSKLALKGISGVFWDRSGIHGFMDHKSGDRIRNMMYVCSK